MTSEQYLKPWQDFVNKNNLKVLPDIKNEFTTDSIEDYCALHKGHMANGGYDFFLKNFGCIADGISIGCEGSTQIYVTFTGDKKELNKIYKDEIQKETSSN